MGNMAIPYLTTATLPYGSRALALGGVTYIANSFSTSSSLQVIDRQDELGAPNGAVGIRQPITGSASLQLATSSTAIPDPGDSFAITVDAVSLTFFITERSMPESQNGFKMVDISFRESV